GRFLEALNQLEQRAIGADLALVYFGGHGLASEEGNILTPIDAKVNCATGAVTQGVLVEQIMAATPAGKTACDVAPLAPRLPPAPRHVFLVHRLPQQQKNSYKFLFT